MEGCERASHSLQVFLPSFLESISPDVKRVGKGSSAGLLLDSNGFHYRMMLGYDSGDPTYDDPVLLAALGKARFSHDMGGGLLVVGGKRQECEGGTEGRNGGGEERRNG